MDSLYKLLDSIRIRPIMFLGKSSIELLRVFISGYMLGKKESDMETYYYGRFQTFIEDKYDRKGTEHWETIIRSMCSSDEEAFYKFFYLLDEFIEKCKNENI